MNLILLLLLIFAGSALSERKFEIDHVNNTFLMDDQPFQYVSGSIHYFRSIPETWQRKLRLMRAAGLNAIDIYIHWAIHNPKDGVYNFEHFANLERFLEIATEEGLYIILRPGPYICAETDNGGLPYWLARKYPGIKVRTSDPNYMREVARWWSVLMPKLERHWYGNGGNIIMTQIENEYGSLNICDKKYLNFLRDETEKYVKGRSLLFTVDMPYGNALECGQVDGVFVTTDFGINSASNVQKNFDRLREVQKTGPLVNSEYYAGWFTFWHDTYQKNSAYDVAATLRMMLDMKANVNFYMFFGGTNFGFWSGANNVGLNKYVPDITSYDYDAPLDEAGDTTIKYNKIKGAISEYFEIPRVTLFSPIKKVSLESIELSLVDSILSPNGRRYLGTRLRRENKLLTFEELDQFSGFVLYETEIPEFTRDPSNLVIEDLRDRALIYVDNQLLGVLSREHNIKSLPISAGMGEKLQILVENQGRINFEIMDDYKGILGNVTVQQFYFPYEQILRNWTITGFPFENHDLLYEMIENSQRNQEVHTSSGPVIFHADVELKEEDLGDTYWDTKGWGKGFLIVNGFNLGRYWPLAGPQMTLFIPKDLLKIGKNKFTIVEQQLAPRNRKMNFVDKPIFVNH